MFSKTFILAVALTAVIAEIAMLSLLLIPSFNYGGGIKVMDNPIIEKSGENETVSNATEAGTKSGKRNDKDSNDEDDNGEADNKNDNDEDIWVSAYFASWNHYAEPEGNWGKITSEEIDWDSFTHMIYFNILANSDGSLGGYCEDSPCYENINPSRIKSIVSAAHENKKPVLISIGGAGNTEFSNAIKTGSREILVSNLIEFTTKWGFDGIDLDMEVWPDEEVSQNYAEFVKLLHSSLQEIDMEKDYDVKPVVKKPLLTTATGASQISVVSDLEKYFDQINIMTYDMSGVWPGWVSWHNSPLHDNGFKFYSTGRKVPSADSWVDEFIAAGIDRKKIGIGIDFYGYEWKGGRLAGENGSILEEGVSEPRQKWDENNPPSRSWQEIPYEELAERYGLEENNENNPYYRWDDFAKVSYLSINSSNPDEDMFVSFDDKKTSMEKIKYARNKGIGGVIIWEISGGYINSINGGKRNYLLEAVKEELREN